LGIDIDIPRELTNQILDILKLYPELHIEKKFHTTLLFVGRKKDVDETNYYGIEHKMAKLHVNAIAHSDFGICLRIKNIMIDDCEVDLDKPHHISVTNKIDKLKGTSYSLTCGSIIDTDYELTGIVTRHA